MLEHALAYARAGWRVMPLHHIGADGFCTCRPTERRPKAGPECPSPGKHPRIKTGRAFEAATTDEAQIRAWWKKWPKANIGIATGQASRLAVVDIDGQKGFDTLAALLAAQGQELPATLMARSGRVGVGAHLYFACDDPSPSNSGDGLDIRGDGGNLVAPPSMHISGQPYAWANTLPPVPMPPWLLHWFKNRDREERPEASKVRAPPQGLPAHLQGRPGAGLTARATLVELPPIADVEAALEAIPNDNRSWDEWNRIGMAVWRATDGSEEGEIAFDYWGQKSAKYDPEAAAERWRAYSGSPPDSIGYGSLWYEAKQADPTWSPPSHARIETIPLEMRAFSQALPNQSPNDRSTFNGQHLNGHAGPTPQLFVQKDPDNPLIELNDKFSVIGNLGGKCLIMEWVELKSSEDYDETIKIPTFQSARDFALRFGHRYINVRVEKKEGEFVEEAKQLGAYWLKWNNRKTFEGIDLVPEGPPLLPGNVLNLWSGFAVIPMPGSWARIRQHITDVLADGNVESARYIIRWAAWCVQNPGRRAEVALVLRGAKGIGKGAFAHAMRRIFGHHGLHISNSKHFVGQFNSHLQNCLLLFADEAFWAGDKQGESVLKALITESTMSIEKKGIDLISARNRLKVIMAANAEWVVPASADERRYAVFNVSDRFNKDKNYKRDLFAEMNGPGLAAMLHDLLEMDLGSWHPRDVIQTKGLLEQKMESLSPLQQWFSSILEDGALPGGSPDQTVPAAALIHHGRDGWDKLRYVSPKAMGHFLAKHGCIKVHTRNGNAWRFPDLAAARATWAQAYGGEWPWEHDVAGWISKAGGA